MTLKEYLIELLKGAKTYVDTERSEITSEYAALIGPIEARLPYIDDLIEALQEQHRIDMAENNAEHEEMQEQLDDHEARIIDLEREIDEKIPSELVLPWATYDKTNKILQLGVPGSPIYIKSTTTGLEIYQGTTRIAYFEGGHLKATDITTSGSMTTPKITVGGLEISGNSTNGWSFR